MKKLYLILVPTVVVTVVCVFCSFNTGTRESVSRVNGIKFRIADTTEDLPRQYKQRKFLNDISSMTEKFMLIPGNIVKFNPLDTAYEFKTLHGIIKGNRLPVSTVVNDGTIYSSLITSQTSFNGSYLIGGFRAEKDEVMDITIRDEAISVVPDSLVDIDAIKSAVAALSAEDRKGMFYVKAATISVIESKKYKLTKFDITKNAFYITRNGKTYGNQEKAKAEKVVSMFLVPLDKLTY
jgi:hypothetical protein